MGVEEMMWFNEYYQEGSGVPVNLSIGMPSKEEAIQHGKTMCRVNGYCAFWILSKRPMVGDPAKVEYHARILSPRGEIQWMRPIRYADTFAGSKQVRP